MQYAEYNDIQVVGSYIDRALSAKTDNRPNFQKMIKDSAKRIFDVIIVWKLDRFARNRFDSAYYKNVLKKNGVRVVSAKESISEGAEGIILESVLEGFKRSNGHKNLNYNQSSLINALSNHFYFRPKGSLYKAAFRLLTAY